jgi:anti-sigma factor ChrR (cupin superfamily)
MSDVQVDEMAVRAVRPDQLDWLTLGTNGLRRKLLAFDPQTQAATSLVDIPTGWKGGGIAHYHDTFEEVYIVQGSVTLDGTNYWTTGDYFYRPADVVHGHDEKSPEGCLALIRCGGPLELLLIHDPADPDEYPLKAINDPRGHVRHVLTATAPNAPDSAFPSAWRIKRLSVDPHSRARTVMAHVPAGWTAGEATPLDRAWEAYVLEGSLEGPGGLFEAGDFADGPAGIAPFEALNSQDGCTLMVWL